MDSDTPPVPGWPLPMSAVLPRLLTLLLLAEWVAVSVLFHPLHELWHRCCAPGPAAAVCGCCGQSLRGAPREATATGEDSHGRALPGIRSAPQRLSVVSSDCLLVRLHSQLDALAWQAAAGQISGDCDFLLSGMVERKTDVRSSFCLIRGPPLFG